MSKSIAVFGAGPGLGQAVARRYAREGYAVTLVARRSEPLDRLAKVLWRAPFTRGAPRLPRRGQPVPRVCLNGRYAPRDRFSLAEKTSERARP
jgi:NAD(P)-dependent dehydrogenase (short-subunit alcohol dehydrogenase family)